MVTINEQVFLFLTCVKTGIIMGMLYDVIRIFRKCIHHPNWLVQTEDLLYWITCGGFAFVMIYWRNYGQIRAFVFLGILIGTVLYFASFSSLFVKIGTKLIIRFIISPIKCIIRTIVIPINYASKTYVTLNNKRKIHRKKAQIKRRKKRENLKKQLKIIQKKK